jgi:hypothetical protein
MSTPKAGGILPFASFNKGSDGHATITHGNSVSFVSGYQDETTRHSYICSFWETLIAGREAVAEAKEPKVLVFAVVVRRKTNVRKKQEQRRHKCMNHRSASH